MIRKRKKLNTHIGIMHKLSAFLKRIDRSQSWFAAQIGTTPTHLGRLLKGTSIPSLKMAYEIELKTDGLVTFYDWLNKRKVRKNHSEE